MIFNNDTRSRVLIEVKTSFDPATASIELKVTTPAGVSTWYPCDWTAVATVSGTTWTRAARTTGYFAGPAVLTADVAGAVVLAAGRHLTETRVVNGGDRIAEESAPIDVK